MIVKHPWRVLRSREIYRNRWLALREDTILRPNSGEGIYSVVDRLDALVVLPRDADDSITLVRQYRYPVGRQSWELPSGTLEPGEAVLPAAQRELREETGLTAARWTHLGDFWLGPGFCNQVAHAYLAEELTQGPSQPDTIEEDLLVGRFTPSELRAMIASGDLMDALTMVSLYLLGLRER